MVITISCSNPPSGITTSELPCSTSTSGVLVLGITGVGAAVLSRSIVAIRYSAVLVLSDTVNPSVAILSVDTTGVMISNTSLCIVNSLLILSEMSAASDVNEFNPNIVVRLAVASTVSDIALL